MTLSELGIDETLLASLPEEVKDDPEYALMARMLIDPYYGFVPRPDNPDEFDQQTSYIDSTDRVAFLIGGNGSGKTMASAIKAARYLLEKQPPPREDTPFWCISDTYPNACGICWEEKLSKIIPPECIDWDKISWYKPNDNWPFSVPLNPWPGRPGKNWKLEFKSYEQGRQKFSGRSIGGAWFSEQFTWDIFTEVLRGCRDYMFPGGVFAEFTPIDPELVVEVRKRYEAPPAGWGFYRCNTKKNVEWGGVSDEWFEDFVATVSEEMLETRTIGAFAGYEGAIFQNFNPKIHLVTETPIPPAVYHRRSLDWGSSVEHPFCCHWFYRNALGQYVFYDEYWTTSQGLTVLDHIEEIKRRSRRHGWKDDNPYYYQPIYADPSALENHKIFSTRGLSTHPAINDVDRGIEVVRRHLKKNGAIGENGAPMLIINEKTCPKLAEQMGTYRWKRSSGRGLNPEVAKPVPLKRNDDAVDSMRYGITTDYHEIGGGAPKPVNRIWSPRPGLLINRHLDRLRMR